MKSYKLPFKFHYLFLDKDSVCVDYSIYFKIFKENVLIKSYIFLAHKTLIN